MELIDKEKAILKMKINVAEAAAIKATDPVYIGFLQAFETLFVSELNEQPLIDAVKVRHGEWLNFANDFSTAECDQCGEIYEVSPDEKPCKDYYDAFKQFYKLCPNCGAKMDGR